MTLSVVVVKIDDNTKTYQGGESLVLLNYQYRAFLDTNQKLQFNSWLRISQYWYNKQLGDRFDWWQNNRCDVN
nr:helix-turn-helix domain-containing protein [Brasilonema octagenarum]